MQELAKIAGHIIVFLVRVMFALLTAVAPAHAGAIEVSPIVIEMPAGLMSSLLTVNNRGGQAASIQVRAFAWSQDATQDNLLPTRALLVSPPIFEVPAGGSQTVRVVLREPATISVAAFRLLLDELPSIDSPGVIQMALRISMPVFASPPGATKADLQWRVQSTGRDAADIVAVNHGTGPERVSGLAMALDRLGVMNAAALVDPWVLPGSERHWQVKLAHTMELHGPEQARLTAKLLTSDMSILVPLVRAP